MMKRIDFFLQKENVILVNSAGNIYSDSAYYQRKKYPEYLTKNPVFCPAEGRNVFSVGAIAFGSKAQKTNYSKQTRIGVHPIFINEELDKFEYIKPDIHTYGGDSIPSEIELQKCSFRGHWVSCINQRRIYHI